jgi:hypothetical protein
MKTWIRSAEYFSLRIGSSKALLKKSYRADGSIL